MHSKWADKREKMLKVETQIALYPSLPVANLREERDSETLNHENTVQKMVSFVA